MDRIVVPEHVSQGLPLLPNGVAVASWEKSILGKSKTQQPKLTVRYAIIEEMENADPNSEPTIGAIVLDTYSLQPQALFRLEEDYKAYTGEPKLPMGDYSYEEFHAMVEEKMAGSMWNLVLEQRIPEGSTDGKPRTTITSKTLRR